MKKIIQIGIAFIILFSPVVVWGDCSYDGGGQSTDGIVSSLEGCLSGTDLVAKGQDLEVTGGFKDQIIAWTKKIGGVLAIGAVFAIAFGALKMVLSFGEEDKLKKAKDIIKWGVLGFLGVVSAGFLITLVVTVFYALG